MREACSIAALIGLALGAAPARGQDAVPGAGWLAVHGQMTVAAQAVPDFRSTALGPNSLAPDQVKETVDATLYVGVHPWQGGEFWINPEADQGFGLSNTLGAAGFPSGEAYKVGKANPYIRLQRLFFRQTIGLGGEAERVSGDLNQFAGSRRRDRLVVTIGKFGVADIFDTNRYAHDPRQDFLNWSIIDTGSFDYAADAWGYSSGIAAELYRGPWTVRAGLFNLSKVPNGETLETGFRQYQLDGEIERRFAVAGRPGAVRLTVFRNRGRFGRFDDALRLGASSASVPTVALVRRERTRMGVSFNLEQAVTSDIGVFARAGIADGNIEPYDFTDIDRTGSIGASIAGKAWGRNDDTLGVAAVANGISRSHERYLDAGGLGILVGDGRLPHPGAEMIVEAYYTWRPLKAFNLTIDYQFLANPGYNRERGPVSVVGARLHGQF